MKTVILISGPKRGGKDYTASMLEEKLKEHETIQNLSFAYPIKKIMASTFDISLEELDTLKNDKEPLYTEVPKLDGYDYKEVSDFRLILQRFGTEAMKPLFGEAVWANLLLSRILDDTKPGIVLVPDFRFNIESEIIKSSNYRVITLYVRNDGIDSSDSHASERELDEYVFDYEINNTGYTDNLERQINTFIKDMSL